MAEDKKREDILDSFWDLSKLIPDKKTYKVSKREITLTEIDTNATQAQSSRNERTLTFASQSENNGVISKTIPSRLSGEETCKYENVTSFTPENSLIHRVTLKKKQCALAFYDGFVRDAERYIDSSCDYAEYVPFFSYVPQYNQLDEKQLDYYFFWRSSVRRGFFENTDYSYILLYVFELINTANEENARECQERLTDLWRAYSKSYPMLSGKLLSWICDLSLIHRLPPPRNMTIDMVSSPNAFKEFFISVPNGDFDLCVESLLKYCTSYDYTTSKFAVGENRKIYDKYIRGSLRQAVNFYSEDGKILSKLSAEDSKMTREAFSGALCAEKNRYIIEISYCSFSRSNELRFLIGDIIKYAENKIRGLLGIKSRLTVYSVTNALKEEIDRYFSDNSASVSVERKKKEIHEYDVLYDVPRKKLSLSEAIKIENDSWDTTNDLVSAFEESDKIEGKEAILHSPVSDISFEAEVSADDETIGDEELASALGKLYELAIAIKEKDKNRIRDFVSSQGKMLEALVDEINEIAVDVIGDIIIEDDGDGFGVIDCYKDMV